MADSSLLNHETLGTDTNPAIIIIHGLFGDKDNLKSVARELSENYFCILPDARNHGDSFHSDTMTYAAMAEDILNLANALEIEQFYLLGHSMGGKIAMETCMKAPDRIKAAIFADISPTAYEGTHDSIMEALSSLNISQVKSRGDADKQLAEKISEKGIRQFLLKNLQKTDNGYQWRLNLDALKHNYQLISAAVSKGQYSGPVLFIKGGNSNYLTEKHQQEVRSRFSNASVKVIEGTGHWLHAEKPRLFNRLVTEFLTE
ncbi:alpha/beta fold hydrolase [Idiomarina sp. HP20-50]|uniref:alpha/beta fold hydrolase n=1 Tax=Idiomarina sp. HP20-50 TaxID=3070813 RepID=UPI00294AAAA2|nr:alpha/beta fold hydrolase [Idiomarina sp. HP20-50]MDV6314937.1 alpha/beta fold hydrolase [Idiomarina sp. HP20-50]